MKKIAYIGPSWALRSFDTPEGSEEKFTNLTLELKLDVTNLADFGTSNISCLNKLLYENQHRKFDAVIWVYCNILHDIPQLLPITKRQFIESENFWSIREEANQQILAKINNLYCPVALIGASSDIVNCDYPNITVIHPSWQKFLADQVGVKLEHGWEAEVAHRWILQDERGANPSRELVFKTSETLRAWNKMDMLGVFNFCHPNRKGNELFAKEIKSSVYSFINHL